ncbi:MAG TPA: hypothetical protein VH110_03145 [Candidatus Acidoferrum sp.]|jgi:hypothetical protein|nr:hypothetical protein [Candidatus Acidoferrum sp.]
MKRKLNLAARVLLFAVAIAAAADHRLNLLPRLQAGQIITYLIRYQSVKNVKTESKVAAPMAPNAAQLDAHGLLQIEIVDVQQAGGKLAIHAKGRFLTLDSDVWAKKRGGKKPNWDVQRIDPKGKSIEFTISPDGFIGKITGLDSLFPEQQQAWQEWAARFALAWTFPVDGVKLAEKWKSEQAERAEAPITGLYWERESVYVRDEPCRPTQLTVTGEVSVSSAAAESCAVVLTTAKLKQKSPPKDATPEDFKLYDLRTMGTAKGTNEIITYISLRTGLVVRATEEAKQFMDVVVAMADGSNGVHYNLDATSHSEALLVTETLFNQR